MTSSSLNGVEHARRLIDAFAQRTGLAGTGGDPCRRYLWTDAFAVQACFGLARGLEEFRYRNLAVELIDRVHEVLGRFHPDDERDGWISGLPDEEVRRHPTVAGLRIGKSLPERAAGEPLDERMEWDRDGQYFHYLTRWFAALSQAASETGDSKYDAWAAELIVAAGRFVHGHPGRPRMYWKMSTDLSRPLVPSMGAHDPLEGLICVLSARQSVAAMQEQLQPLVRDFESMCAGQDWATTDALGIGGLALATARAARLVSGIEAIPDPVRPASLWNDTHRSLQAFVTGHRHAEPADRRLPFRECGMALGLRSLHGARPYPPEAGLKLDALECYMPIATTFEEFWREEQNQDAATWRGHLDINAVTLASSLVAARAPGVFA